MEGLKISFLWYREQKQADASPDNKRLLQEHPQHQRRARELPGTYLIRILYYTINAKVTLSVYLSPIYG